MSRVNTRPAPLSQPLGKQPSPDSTSTAAGAQSTGASRHPFPGSPTTNKPAPGRTGNPGEVRAPAGTAPVADVTSLLPGFAASQVGRGVSPKTAALQASILSLMDEVAAGGTSRLLGPAAGADAQLKAFEHELQAIWPDNFESVDARAFARAALGDLRSFAGVDERGVNRP